MKAINFMNLDELHTALEKKCNVSLNVIGFPSESCIGILKKIDFDTPNDTYSIILQVEESSITILLNQISSLVIDE